jgi:hypothetical protein
MLKKDMMPYFNIVGLRDSPFSISARGDCATTVTYHELGERTYSHPTTQPHASPPTKREWRNQNEEDSDN